jgi:hypothetical protein
MLGGLGPGQGGQHGIGADPVGVDVRHSHVFQHLDWLYLRSRLIIRLVLVLFRKVLQKRNRVFSNKRSFHSGHQEYPLLEVMK